MSVLSNRRILLLIGLLLALAVPELPLSTFVAPNTTLTGHIEREAFFWAILILIVCYVLFVERRPPASIGLRRPGWKTLAFGAATGIILFAGVTILIFVIFPIFGVTTNQAAYSNIMRTPLWFRFGMIVRAAVFEEICFRGYAIERISELTGSKWIAAAISVAVFTYAHLGHWGWSQLIVAGFGGVVLTAFYLWRHDLPANMIAHFIGDIGFLF